MNEAKKHKQTFLLSQRLSELVGVTDVRQRMHEICGKADDDAPAAPEQREATNDPWQNVDRKTIVGHAAGPEPWRRALVVCDAGLGKSTNMAWLQAAIAEDLSNRRLPVLLQLDEGRHEEILLNAHKVSNPLFDWLIDDMKARGGGEPYQLARALERLFAQGRITFLIDGLDHVLAGKKHIESALHDLFTKNWSHCPVWLSGRPYAFRECWSLVKDPAWCVVKVQPLNQDDARFYLSKEVEPGIDKPTHPWLTAVTEEGRHLLATPRFLHLVSRRMRSTVKESKAIGADSFAAVRRLKLSTRADLYHLAYCEPGQFESRKIAGEDDAVNSRGLIAQGLKTFEPPKDTRAKFPGLPEGIALDEQNYPEAVENIRALLGALAFEMYAHPEKLQLPADDESAASGAKRLEPFTRAIPSTPAKIYRDFKDAVTARLIAAAALTIKELNIDAELEPIGKMNVGAVDFLLFRNLSVPGGLRWHDRTVQAFFAAHWAMRYGSDDDLALLRKWIVDEEGKRLAGFGEFWKFAAEMPDELTDRKRWLQVFGPCYTRPIQLTGSNDYVQWHRRMVYHSFELMKQRSPKTIVDWREKTPEQKAIVAEIEAGWREIAPGVCHYRAEPSEDRRDREIQVPGFRMHEWPVINRWYEAFDPAHRATRWNYHDKEHPLGSVKGREGEDFCPVVNVTWFDGWNYAMWLGDHVYLPSEVQWEHACRKETAWDYYFEGGQDELLKPCLVRSQQRRPHASHAAERVGSASQWQRTV